MSRHRRGGGQEGSADDAAATITVCRGCCCGSARRHPDVDHAHQLAALRKGVAGAGRVRVSDCLGVCERSNVMVVTPSSAGRRTGARPVWLGTVLDEDATDDLITWVRSGGPGISEPPDVLDLYVFCPSSRVRKAAPD